MFGQGSRGRSGSRRMSDTSEDREEVNTETSLRTAVCGYGDSLYSESPGNPPATKPTTQPALDEIRSKYPNNPCATTWKMTRCDKTANISLKESSKCKAKFNSLLVQGGRREKTAWILLFDCCTQAITCHMYISHRYNKEGWLFIRRSWALN